MHALMRQRKHTSTKAESAFAADSRSGFFDDTATWRVPRRHFTSGSWRQESAREATRHSGGKPPSAGRALFSVASRPQKDRTMDQYNSILYLSTSLWTKRTITGWWSPGRPQRPYGLLVTGQPRTSTETDRTDYKGRREPAHPQRPYRMLGTGSPGRPQRPYRLPFYGRGAQDVHRDCTDYRFTDGEPRASTETVQTTVLRTGSPGRPQRLYRLPFHGRGAQDVHRDCTDYRFTDGEPRTTTETVQTTILRTGSPGRPQRLFGLLGTRSSGRPKLSHSS